MEDDMSNVTNEDIIEALATLSLRLHEHRAKRERGRGSVFELLTIEDIMNAKPEVVTDPVEAAFKMAIRRLGEMLHAAGGTEHMRETLYEAAERTRHGHTIDMLDHAWNGIGGEWHA